MKIDPIKVHSLVGCWLQICGESDADKGASIMLEFRNDGELIYSIEQKDRVQVINLTFYVQGNEIVTEQKSAPKKHRTTFSFQEDGLLLMNSGNDRYLYRRV